jgi:outer membrane protein assembly factor BamB
MNRRALLALLAVLIAGGGVGAYLLLKKPKNVSHPEVSFKATPPPVKRAPADKFVWPIFGYDAARTHYLPAPRNFHGPWHRQWVKRGVVLTEFSPIMARDSIYWLKNDGNIYALGKRKGHERWHRRLGVLAAASPAWDKGNVYVVLLKRAKGVDAGRVASLRGRDGHINWKRDLPSRTESSPIVVGKLLIFGSESGTIYAVHADTGRTAWTFQASGAVKGGLALANGKLYFGTYGGNVYAISARNGAKVWQTSGGANFYSTAAVAFGRVYIGNTDSRVYSFSAASGKLAWATGTGSYVYGSPAVADVPHLGPTVYVGSYDKSFYAFDARSGSVRWSHPAGGRISGSPALVGSTVYFSDLANRRTLGLDARTGKQVFRLNDGAFTPVISDGKWLFVNGYASLYALSPRGR